MALVTPEPESEHVDDAEVVCNQIAYACLCREVEGHDGPHVCPCGGSFYFDEDGTFQVVTFPDFGYTGPPLVPSDRVQYDDMPTEGDKL